MAEFSVVDATSGRILHSGNVPYEDLAAQAGRGQIVVQGAYQDDQVWFDPEDGRIETRPYLAEQTHFEIIADGADTATIVSYVPPGTRVRSGALDDRGRPTGEWQDVTAETLVFCTEDPGAYRFSFDPPFPWRPIEITVIARHPG